MFVSCLFGCFPEEPSDRQKYFAKGCFILEGVAGIALLIISSLALSHHLAMKASISYAFLAIGGFESAHLIGFCLQTVCHALRCKEDPEDSQ